MKQNYILLLLCMALMSFAYSQNKDIERYHPFPESDAVWNESEFGYHSNALYSNYFNGEDTLINGLLYQKLYRSNYIFSNTFPSYPDVIGNNEDKTGYLGGLRQDTIAQQVFFFYWKDSVEELLYDFSLEPGDTLRCFLNHVKEYYTSTGTGTDEQWYNILNDISDYAVEINGETQIRKYFHFEYHETHFEYIEGIGNFYGLIEFNIFPIKTGEKYTAYLNCFSHQGQRLYPQAGEACWIIGNEEVVPNQQLLVYPNPSEGEFFVKLPEHEQMQSVQITSTDGKIFPEQSYRYEVVENHVLRIEPNQIPKGILFLQINTNQNQYRQKLVYR